MWSDSNPTNVDVIRQLHDIRPLVKIVQPIKEKFSYFSTKTYVVGTQKNRLISQ